MKSKDEVVRDLGKRLGSRAKVIFLTLAGNVVTWKMIRERCGMSDNQVSFAWESLRSVGLAEGDITWGKEGMVFEEPTGKGWK
jgi:DNA-binding transcriptional regulator GbsR (MarR family)